MRAQLLGPEAPLGKLGTSLRALSRFAEKALPYREGGIPSCPSALSIPHESWLGISQFPDVAFMIRPMPHAMQATHTTGIG